MRGGGGSREGGGMREGGGQLRSGERGTRSEGSAQFRSERGTRENGGARLRAERGTRGERGVEFGYRDRDRRHGRRDGGVFIERGYGYAPAGGCGWLRQPGARHRQLLLVAALPGVPGPLRTGPRMN